MSGTDKSPGKSPGNWKRWFRRGPWEMAAVIVIAIGVWLSFVVFW